MKFRNQLEKSRKNYGNLKLILIYLSGCKRFTKQSIEMLTVSGLQWHLVARLPYSTHLSVAKLVDSATLKPVLKPLW